MEHVFACCGRVGAREAKSAYHMFMWGPRQFQRDITHPRTPTYDQKTPAVLLPSYIKSNSKISLSFTQTFARDIKILHKYCTTPIKKNYKRCSVILKDKSNILYRIHFSIFIMCYIYLIFSNHSKIHTRIHKVVLL